MLSVAIFDSRPAKWFGLLIAMSLAASHARAVEKLPYRAVIVAPEAPIVAGAGPQYYPTAELPRGTEVEVHEHAENGYCAIRPPEGSFSWIAAADVRREDAGLGVVLRGGAPSRIGSFLEPRRDAVHVRLDKDERVRILAEEEIAGVRWMQIAPPDGEFRWVRRDHLKPKTADSLKPQDSTPSTNGAQESGSLGTMDKRERPGINKAQASSTPAIEGSFLERLSQLEIALSRRLAERPNLWRLDDLERQAALLVPLASGKQEQDALRSLGERLDRFAAVANRYRSTRGVMPQVTRTKATAPASSKPALAYDAVGLLRPVVSQRLDGSPRLALIDKQGRVVTLVTEGPDVQIEPYIGQRVGLRGTRGYLPSLRREHLVARSIAILDEKGAGGP